MLKPGTPLVRKVDITKLLDGLEDGEYKVRMQPKGCRWWHGEVEAGDDGKVPASLCKVLVPPLMLESMDEIGIRIKIAIGRILLVRYCRMDHPNRPDVSRRLGAPTP
ncbi:hypothetical protein GJ744_001988 [Endocarpon pusillum]|uniref:Uncharacterized protein n=1 Tax=Endocarpon pusillum TaxID=364733 RepID=A0A8H7ABV3_9EURO|nr:hypothetical protein GJ744_001988 [Endocarpon pusillum]